MLRAAVFALAVVLLPLTVAAVAVDEPLDDPALEARARAIHKQLRCLVCQNQSIEDSNADLARDLRVLVRQRLAAGDSDDEAIAYIVERYGDWVLLQPPVKSRTLILWAGPGLLLLAGAGLTVLWFRRRRAATAVTPLSDDERRRLDALLDDGPGA